MFSSKGCIIESALGSKIETTTISLLESEKYAQLLLSSLKQSFRAEFSIENEHGYYKIVGIGLGSVLDKAVVWSDGFIYAFTCTPINMKG